MPKKVKVEISRLFPGPFLCLVFLAECTRLTAAKKWREILAIVALIYECLYVVAHFVFRQCFKMSDLYVKI